MPSLSALGEMVRSQPQDPRVWADYGVALHASGHPEQGLQCLRQAASLARDDAQTLTVVGGCFERVGALHEALASGRRATQLADAPPGAAALVGRLLTQLGDATAAALTLQVAIRKYPESAALRVAVAQALSAIGRPAEAVEHIDRALEIAPNDPAIHRVNAQLREQLGDEGAYVTALGRVAALDASDVSAAVALGTQMAERGQQAEAVDILLNAAERAPKSAESLFALGSGFLKARALTAAVRHLKEAIHLQPDLAAAHMQLGVALRSLGSNNEAIAAFRRATQLASETPEYHHELGVALLDIGQAREAATVLIRAAAFAPDDATIRGALTRALNRIRHAHEPDPDVDTTGETLSGSFSGDLKLFSVAELLDFLLNQRASGMLMVRSARHGEGRIELYLGAIIGARRPGGRPLSQQLVETDLISQTDLKQSLINTEDLERDGLVASILAARKLIDKTALEDFVHRQVQEALLVMLTWQEGDAIFHREEPKTAWPEPPEVRIDTRWALLNAARRLDEQNRPDPA